MSLLNHQPIIILGGFLIASKEYKELSTWLKLNIQKTVYIIPINKFEWLLTNWPFGWKNILDKLDSAIIKLQKESYSGKVTLIGHSSGGVMARLYLSDNNFYGRCYKGFERVNNLITLGSPHQAKKATKLRSMVDRIYPGSFYSKKVKYISIAGNIELNHPDITKFARRSAKISYRSICQEDNLPGDGLVPIKSALLNNAKHIILDNTSHSSLFGKNWYCSKQRIEQWWSKL
tara:strand:+ start:713 stop:1408 length:696 start_codon:yes stop_codon:yes gene_type:complete